MLLHRINCFAVAVAPGSMRKPAAPAVATGTATGSPIGGPASQGVFNLCVENTFFEIENN